ncbi:MAG: bifunctional phosphopantothenoylcysteine decarboxylase/phosphopantothenate--cysteine ligase CoaBC [Clostridiales bacterium]|nr:bifunctional phosphopantothenoylcysteine decarboxylase/phosphopantothenate--cysteine ligase CoaBC [Clostridiales bacterium]
MLTGKTIILGVTGSIAAYKAANLASLLKKQHADVHVILTKNGAQFITPVTFETLTGNKCLTDTFDRNFQFSVEHVELAKRADLAIIAPASANTIARLAHGLADDMLTTTVLACTCPKLIAPAMNTRMYENPVTQDNLQTLQKYGWILIEPESGRLACGDEGRGKFPDEHRIVEYVRNEIAREKDMKGMRVLVSAGPTIEALDPVRFLSNYSTGKMGYALAKVCRERGADVTLVSGKTQLPVPVGVEMVPVLSAQEMYDALMQRAGQQDVIIMAAAVADYRPASVSAQKIKKSDDDLNLPLERTQDILAALGSDKPAGQILCGFAMETEDMVAHARGKLEHKHLDLIAANNVRTEGAGFGTDTNVITLLWENGGTELGLMSKEEAAARITDVILKIREKKRAE